ncbi:rhamnulokinase [Erysipelothrix larvae]|uniref:Rhamnulokinase n=1 Tax=Erysipelothrix larvae TaxID=1514105 RepID=A0A0X8H220_9FIRM|nr:rhamnulokinase [Erysipelothrix larvae]AMC94504.1 rhamnulokinase [Erysipelothrix larvae]
MKTYIAVDIGASSGRLVKSECVDGTIRMEEIHRFKNEFTFSDGHDRWNVDYLVREILNGLCVLKQRGINECTMGIDTWGVDYCLLDKDDTLLDQPISYRDERTDNAIAQFSKRMSLKHLYEITGIQIQPFNTVFQLSVEGRDRLDKASTLLLIPDYLGFVFTGVKVTERTNASTMQLLNSKTQDWDDKLLEELGISKDLFAPLVEPGSILGTLNQEAFKDVDLPEVTLINVASHDTASAVLGTPGCEGDWAYISSGTWSLLGIETQEANLTYDAYHANYTNEWGACNTIRFLKNIMGMWLIQEVARMQDYEYSYPQLASMASQSPAFQQFIDVNDERFLNPHNMIEALQNYCEETNQVIPKSPHEIVRCVYDSLALCYAYELTKLEKLSKTHGNIKKLHIVGGGANNEFLNQLTADVANVIVEAGPSEATAIGNIVIQMITMGEFNDIKEARERIKQSFETRVYKPSKFNSKIFDDYTRIIHRENRKRETI